MMQRYNKVDEALIRKIREIAGPENVFVEREKMEPYSHDEITGEEYVSYPELVVLPENAGQISRIVKLANEQFIPIVPRGAGTGLACAAVPFSGGIVISLEHMNKIIEVDAVNMFIIAEPGVRTEEIQNTARAAGLFYSGDPSSGDSSTIGGNVSTDAGSNKAVKYGTTRRQIYGVELVTPTGDIVTLGGKLVKNVTGYNLLNLIIGSEGTLGIITKVYIKLSNLIKHKIDILAVFPDLDSTIRTVPHIMTAGIMPAALEFMDNLVIRNCEVYLNEKLPHSEGGYYLIIQLEENNEDVLDDQCVQVDEICTANGAKYVLAADSDRIWKARKCVVEADRMRSRISSIEDMVVPMSLIPEVVKEIIEIGTKFGVRIHCVGHIGDGNIHANILKQDMPDEEWNQKLPLIHDELYKLIYSVGGRLSGEHGIGYKRKGLMAQFADPAELGMMRAVKKALDPNLIMNPGKIFDVE